MIKAIVVDYYGVLARQVHGGWKLDAHFVNLLQNLRKNYKIGLISNSYAKDLAALDPQLDTGLFDLVLISGATGLWKPATIVYETAAQKLGLSPAEILAVDDNASHLEAAAQVGLTTLPYTNFADFQTKLKPLLQNPQ